ncbi:toxin-antitoxin system TumE family protein [Desulfonema magnum]|uniref:Uncharacterized protein n=1 Tax=Desulfonema magnum TaxID=45655 RepID=A0A975BSE3_9BACT|nr:DUF6516 family protein [Desulfonema magnum]QTA90949.1 Uncharacterized protein dnm_070130 [Desulfonema magnum]
MLCPKIRSAEIVDERTVLPNHGYFRARLTLINGDFLEISEYFISDGNQCRPQKYRYQRMDSSRIRLIKRWDNAGHFPLLPGYPHHVHIGSEDNAKPSEPLSIIKLIGIIEQEIEL